MIVDCHCHAGKGDGLTGPWDTDAPLGLHMRRAAAAGIDRTVLFAAFHSDYAVANREVARIVASRPDRFFGLAFVHAARDAGRVHDLVRVAVERYGFVGIKAHRHDGRLSREICEVARTYGIPVLYDPVGEVSVVELVAPEYPDVDFIIPHLGSFADDWRAQQGMIDYLVRYPNVHADTSGIRRFDILKAALDRAGPRKILFGSDGPWLHPGLELHKIGLLGLSARDSALVTGGNFLRLISRRRPRDLRRPPRASADPQSAYRDPWISPRPQHRPPAGRPA